MRLFIALVLFGASLFGQASRQMPRHLVQESATPAARISPRGAAIAHTNAVASAAGFNSADLAGLYVARQYTTAHNGVTHFRFREQFAGIDVYGAEWVVNVDRNGRVLNSGGTLFAHPGADAIPPDAFAAPAALRSAVMEIRSRDPGSYVSIENPRTGKTTRRYATSASGFADQAEGRPVWYAANGALHAGWVFQVPALNGVDQYETLVDNETQRVVATENTTLYDDARGLVFERSSPQPNTTPGIFTLDPRPYVQRTLQPFNGDPVASPQGWVTGNQTAGNNVVAAPNPMGIRFLSPAAPVTAANSDFSFPLELGPGAPNPMFFGEAATVNLFYWANRAHDLFYQAGFDEQAGNFQQDNFGRGGTGGDPLLAFSHFGAAGAGYASLNNAFFSGSGTDGMPASINMYIGGSSQTGVYSDGSLDSEVMVHEYTHGVHVRLVPVSGYQGGAMGEGWADFFALEFTVPEGAPLDGVYPQGEYLFQQFGMGARTRPYSTNMEVNPLTFASFGQVSPYGPESHADGEIWVQALWDVRANLITQLGEAEGRRRVRLLVIDGMKLAPPTPNMIDMRDAILLADRVDFEGASQAQIWSAFAKRGLGIMAQSVSLYSTRVRASFDTPSPAATLKLYEDDYVVGETLSVALQDSNNTALSAAVTINSTSGDSEKVSLARGNGSLFQATVPASASSAVVPGNGIVEVVPGDSLKLVHEEADSGGGSPRTVETTAALMAEYSMTTEANLPPTAGPDERPLVTVPSSYRPTTDNPTTVELPFPFQFFGKTYKMATVHTNGIVTFDGGAYSISTYCNGRSNMLGKTAIAPLWMDLAYSRLTAAAQPNEGVFMSTGNDSVTFRWAAETQPYVTTTSPAPVNFSLTLHKDGRAVAQYGSGNASLQNTSGCSMRPSVGISNGHEQYALMAGPAYDGKTNLQNAPALTFTPPFNGWGWSRPVAVVESPVNDMNYAYGVLEVRGVAYDVELSVTRVDILVDGVPRGQATVGISRPDACQQQAMRGCPNVGFSGAVNVMTAGIAPGRHTLKVRATNARGIVEDFPAEPIAFTVDNPGPAAGAIESPQAGAELSGSVPVTGYAYAPGVHILSVDLLVDGVTYGSTQYNRVRDDICGKLSPAPPNCPNVGFTYTLNTKRTSPWLPNGSHSMQVRTSDEMGRTLLFPETPLKFTVNNPPNQLPQAVLAAPKPGATLSGVVDISGYAWDPDGRVTSVYLIVDGSTLLPGGGSATLNYGSLRPDECAQLPNVPACPNIGFEGRLDTRMMSNGLHTLGVYVYDDQGASAVFPKLIRYGMNIYVQN